MNIFESAARQKIRFDTMRGAISTEQLFDIPLASSSGLNLDVIAIGISRALKEAGEESFVTPAANSAHRTQLELKLELVKFVIADKIAAADAAKALAAKREQRTKLIEQLGKKQDEKLGAMSEDEIKAALAALD